jgi:hypothetical protein
VRSPQRSSTGSHTPVAQAREPIAEEHGAPGIETPLAVLATHTPAWVTLSHQCPPAQSASAKQFVLQAPVPELQ